MRRRLTESRTAARNAIHDGRVRVAGIPRPKASTLVDPSDPISLAGPEEPYVSRGGRKLAAALAEFDVSVEGRRALDAGASTGGFTDCLLQRGAASVTALDVGYGQLHWRLRGDARVRVVERTNLRHAHPGELGAPFDVVVADLSFISLVAVAPALAGMGDERTDHVLLVKPQFEVGKDKGGKGGIVRDPALHREALEAVIDGLAKAGIGVRRAVASPVEGTEGNREFFVWAEPGDPTVTAEELAEVTGENRA